MIQLTGLSKTYGQGPKAVNALDGVSMDVAAGELVLVCGPSGCGKSTLLLVAGGLLAPTSGQVAIDGRDPYGMSAEPRAAFRARTVGFVFQQFCLVPYLTVRQNVLSPALAGPGPGGDSRARADELIGRFGLTGRRDHLPDELSAGEKQRTALARALLHSPRLLLADEPTGNLDQDNGRLVVEFLRQFADAGGAVLMVTHDHRWEALADRTVTLEFGRLVGLTCRRSPAAGPSART